MKICLQNHYVCVWGGIYHVTLLSFTILTVFLICKALCNSVLRGFMNKIVIIIMKFWLCIVIADIGVWVML